MPSPNEVLNRAFDETNNVMKVTSGGTVASGATDSGNPVKVGGRYSATLPTLTDGQRGDANINNKGDLRTNITAQFGATYNTANMVGNLSNANSGSGLLAVAAQGNNGSTYDHIFTNQEVALLASAARTTTQTGADITNYNGTSSLIVVLDMTTVGTGSVTLTIEGKDTASGKYYTILSGTAVTTNSTNRYRVSPNLAAAANSVAQDILPRVFRITVTANNANAATYSVGYCLIRS